ncbi:hypothetical protein OF83DRAFT_1093764 [Amylostereum chailletii]|nr:hypothetical protein OF83DRAFT_1093764 [Amylostereum chailletii]
MSAAIHDPFLLGTYDVSAKFATAATDKHGRNPALFLTHHPASAGQEGYATVAVPGDGVHILDVSDVHLASSYALGPSTSFACPAVARIAVEEGVSVRKTYVAVSAAPEVKKENAGREVWVWTEPVAGLSSARAQDKKTVVLPRAVSRLYAPEYAPEVVVALSQDGTLTLVDSELNVLHEEARPGKDARLLKSFVLQKSACSFLPSSTITDLAVVVITAVDKDVQLSLVSVGEEGIRRVLEQSLGMDESAVADVSCSTSGYITVLQTTGLWSAFQLENSDAQTLSLRSLASSPRLSNLSPLSTSTRPSSAPHSIALLALNTSLVLLAGITTEKSAPSIALLLWDLRYSVLLASHILPIPSPLAPAHSKEGISVHLVPATPNQALLVLSPHAPARGSTSRSVVLAVPLAVPPRSTIANAMGKAAAAAKWLAEDHEAKADPTLDPDQRTLVDAMRAAMQQNRTGLADNAFFEFLEKAKGKAASEGKQVKQEGVVLGHEFVRAVLDVCLQPSQAPSTVYSFKTTNYLLRHKIVTSAMVDGGLLPVLLVRQDWTLVKAALQTVIDIPEDHLLAFLRSAVLSHAKPSNDDAMEVDSASGGMALREATALCVRYTMSAPALSLAFRQKLPEAENIVAVLEVLDEWLQGLSSQDKTLFPPTGKTKGASKSNDGIPALDKIITFLRSLLDASFLALLQYPPAHTLLRRLSAHLEPELSFVEEVQQLRAPLELYVKAHARASEKKDVVQQDWRQRRKAGHERATMGIGLYQVEELVI